MFRPLILFFILPLISSNHHLHSFPPIEINPNDYSKPDLILHNFQHEFHPTYSYHCLLQTESKYFHLDSSCQLFTRTSLKQICPLNYTLKLEIVFSTKYNNLSNNNSIKVSSFISIEFNK
jgi:hypothetical protein